MSSTPSKNTPIALTIAGSDCSGGAGIQADIKTFAAHKVYGMSAMTCAVAENPKKVVSIHPIPPPTIKEQIQCCLKDMRRVAVKTGMLYSASAIQACHRQMTNYKGHITNLVVDPVMVATSGKRLLKPDAIRSLKDLILKHADLVTPNLDEAEILANQTIRNEAQIEKAAHIIAKRFKCSVLLKGGHLKDPRWASDFFWDGKKGFWLRSPRIRNVKTHGTGCTYSAAITANLALGFSMTDSVRRAKKFITNAIRYSCCFKPWMALNHQH